MTFKELQALIENNNIPHNVKLLSDSGWECSPTDIEVGYYNKKANHLIFTRLYRDIPTSSYNYEKDDNYIRIE